MMIQQQSPFPFPQPLLHPIPFPPHAQRRMMIQRMLHPQEPFPKPESPHPQLLSQPQPFPQLLHPHPDLSSQPQFVAAKSLMSKPPENIYTSSYGRDRRGVTNELTGK